MLECLTPLMLVIGRVLAALVVATWAWLIWHRLLRREEVVEIRRHSYRDRVAVVEYRTAAYWIRRLFRLPAIPSRLEYIGSGTVWRNAKTGHRAGLGTEEMLADAFAMDAYGAKGGQNA